MTPVGKRRIVLTALGSLGDLHPYLAMARGLQARGHEAIVASGEFYRQKIESLGLGFRAIRPDCAWTADPAMMRRMMHPRWGLWRVGREWILPAMRESYVDTLAAAEGADLLVSHPLTGWSTRLVAEKTGIRWASTMLVPLGFFSVHDLTVSPLSPAISQLLGVLGPAIYGPLQWSCKRATRFVAAPWYHLRRELGLPPTGEDNPLVDTHSPSLVLAPFSKRFADKQPDWPAQTLVSGFPYYDGERGLGLPAELERFLEAGPPPVVFTLGTAVSHAPGAFFEESAAAAQRLGCRAVLVLNKPENRPASLPDGVVAFDYVRFSALFPRAAAIVHQGGIGTTGLAMRAGRPMLVVPHAWDQFDHAARVTRLGIARTIRPSRYVAKKVADELRQLLDDPAYATRASEIGQQIRKEDGIAAACDALESLF